MYPVLGRGQGMEEERYDLSEQIFTPTSSSHSCQQTRSDSSCKEWVTHNKIPLSAWSLSLLLLLSLLSTAMVRLLTVAMYQILCWAEFKMRSVSYLIPSSKPRSESGLHVGRLHHCSGLETKPVGPGMEEPDPGGPHRDPESSSAPSQHKHRPLLPPGNCVGASCLGASSFHPFHPSDKHCPCWADTLIILPLGTQGRQPIHSRQQGFYCLKLSGGSDIYLASIYIVLLWCFPYEP